MTTGGQSRPGSNDNERMTHQQVQFSVTPRKPWKVAVLPLGQGT